MTDCSYCGTKDLNKFEYDDHCRFACWQKCKDYDEAIKAAYDELSALWSFYGQGLGIINWHLNGAEEPLDSFFDDNNYGALEKLKKCLKL